MKQEVQSVMVGVGSISMIDRPGYTIRIHYGTREEFAIAVETNDTTGEKTKELWLGTGVFISYKES